MPSNIPTNPQNAPIVKTGHTANDKYGAEPDAKVKGGNSVRDLGIKAK